MMPSPLRLMAIGAHPDDAELEPGGLAALDRPLGHAVLLLSLTDGCSGLHERQGPMLACRRAGEAQRAAELIGAQAWDWDDPDVRLEPTVRLRERLIRAPREFRPNRILSHRPFDDHAGHRAAGLLVQDATRRLRVPEICPETPRLEPMPEIANDSDEFRLPDPFQADLVIDGAEVWDAKLAMRDAHASRFAEWLPSHHGSVAEVPDRPAERRAWRSEKTELLSRRLAKPVRERPIHFDGPSPGRIAYRVEAFEVSEFGYPLDQTGMLRLFPTLPARMAG